MLCYVLTKTKRLCICLLLKYLLQRHLAVTNPTFSWWKYISVAIFTALGRLGTFWQWLTCLGFCPPRDQKQNLPIQNRTEHVLIMIGLWTYIFSKNFNLKFFFLQKINIHIDKFCINNISNINLFYKYPIRIFGHFLQVPSS